jgi:hypothetical protein
LTSNIFRELEELGTFVSVVGDYFRCAPGQLDAVLSCEITVDDQRLSYAHGEYIQGIQLFSLLLQSGDPDHYKRAGALLHALYLSKPITEIGFDPPLDQVDTLITPIGVSYGSAENALSFGHFFRDYPNEFMGFSLAYNYCHQYESDPRIIDFNYLHTVCNYLKNNGNLSVESLFMVFKSLMI